MGNFLSSRKKYQEFKNIDNKNLLISNFEDRINNLDVIVESINKNIKTYSLSNNTILSELRTEISNLTNELNRNIKEQQDLKDNVKKILIINNNITNKIIEMESLLENNDDMFIDKIKLDESSKYLDPSIEVD